MASNKYPRYKKLKKFLDELDIWYQNYLDAKIGYVRRTLRFTESISDIKLKEVHKMIKTLYGDDIEYADGFLFMLREYPVPNFLNEECHDCGVEEGQVHKGGCDTEICPFCYGQLISCDCDYKKLGLVDKKNYPKTDGLSPKIYKEGLTDEQSDEWDRILKKKGLIPFIIIPNFCRRCLQPYPDMFMVPDEEWKLMPRFLQKEILCRDCFETIKEWVIKHKPLKIVKVHYDGMACRREDVLCMAKKLRLKEKDLILELSFYNGHGIYIREKGITREMTERELKEYKKNRDKGK